MASLFRPFFFFLDLVIPSSFWGSLATKCSGTWSYTQGMWQSKHSHIHPHFLHAYFTLRTFQALRTNDIPKNGPQMYWLNTLVIERKEILIVESDNRAYAMFQNLTLGAGSEMFTLTQATERKCQAKQGRMVAPSSWWWPAHTDRAGCQCGRLQLKPNRAPSHQM